MTTMKNKVVALLRGDVAGRIRFKVATTSAGTITITRHAFRDVATAVDSGKIKVTPKNTFAEGVGAEYDGTAIPNHSSGNLLVPPIIGREQEGLIMHECTHAVFDLTMSGIAATEEEAVCYVVDALYFRMTGLRPPRWNNEPHKTAGGVADKLLNEYQKGDVAVPMVDAASFGSLVTAVALNATYFMHQAGLLGGIIGPNAYPHDG